MKRILCALICAVTVFAFCSCTFQEERIDSFPDNEIKQEEKKEEKPVKDKTEEKRLSKKEVIALADAALEKMSIVPEYPEGYPTLDDVVAQYEKANQAIGWIINTEPMATNPDDTHKAHGFVYQRVLPDCHYGDDAGKSEDNQKLIYDRATLEAYIATLIHPEEASDYMIDLLEGFDVPRITAASNGALYALTYPYTPEGYGEDDKYELTPNGDGSYTFSVTYTTLADDGSVEGEYTKNYGYENVDGRWVFTNFRVIKQ